MTRSLNTLKLSCCSALLLLLAACANQSQKPDVEPQHKPSSKPQAKSQQDDEESPDELIDEASQSFQDSDIDQNERLVWDRLISNLSFPACEPGSKAHDWQKWYVEHTDYMQRVWSRASPWLNHVLDETQARDLPIEFALLPVIESAYNVFAYSHAGAAGGWQFTSATAKDYDLPINQWYDGRRDMYAATSAALNLLQAHMNRYENNWRLALAAYNSGPGRVNRALEKTSVSMGNARPARMSLPEETREFAPKLHGLSCYVRNAPAAALPKIVDRPAIVPVPLQQPVDLAVAALMSDMPVETLYTLNAGFSQHITPASGPNRLIVPVESADSIKQQLDKIAVSSIQPTTQLKVQRGDTLNRIARRHNTNVATLKAVNNLNTDIIYPGQVLLTQTSMHAGVPGYESARKKLDQLQAGLVPQRNTTHRIARGENLGSIADKYGVSVSEIQRWNNITNANRIREGQVLTLKSTRVLAANKKTQNYRVQPGDSLWRIARRYDVSVTSLRSWNSLSKNDLLQPGQILKVRP